MPPHAVDGGVRRRRVATRDRDFSLYRGVIPDRGVIPFGKLHRRHRVRTTLP